LEAGYEKQKGTLEGAEASRFYNENAYVLSIRVNTFYSSTPPKPFESVVSAHYQNIKESLFERCRKILAAQPTSGMKKWDMKNILRFNEFSTDVDLSLPPMELLLQYPSRGFQTSLRNAFHSLENSLIQ
jgi:hypothetical protein